MSGISLTTGGLAPMNPDIEFVQGNDGIPVPPNPTTHIVILLGDNTQGVDTSGDAGTYTETITIFDSTTSQKGVVLLASNAETIAGSNTTKATTPDDIKAKLGAQTLHGIPYGNSQTGAIQWLAEATDGQLPIGHTGGVPVLANITSPNGSITVTNGPGSIGLDIANMVLATVTTTDATPTTLLTFSLGATPGTILAQGDITAYNVTDAAGASYTFVGAAVTTGLAGTEISVENKDIFEQAAMSAADFDLGVSGNNAVITVTGIAGKTINWSALFTYRFVG